MFRCLCLVSEIWAFCCFIRFIRFNSLTSMCNRMDSLPLPSNIIVFASGRSGLRRKKKAAEANEGQGVNHFVKDTAEWKEVDRTKCTKANREFYRQHIARCTGSEAATGLRLSSVWKKAIMVTELGSDTKIHDLWRMTALLEICHNEVREQIRLLLDEI